MPTLGSELRNKLERAVVEARDVAEAGARAALEALAVHEAKYYPHMSKHQQDLRNHLRARARQLGDQQGKTDRLGIGHLVGECAYEHWHRMLFARFLAENNLLIEPQENMAISLAEAEELAKEEGVDVWVFASRCAQDMLPQIFRPDDPLLQVSFAMEHRIKLEALLASLPAAVFTASDALGWVYQFWQTQEKKRVNESEIKIGADEISAVTQLFTEPYMVEFLLHNTLGAWWAGKGVTAEDTENAKTEQELRNRLALPGVDWAYLRFVHGADGTGGPWRPAAGTFDGWPKAAKDIKVLDPCCGSGHFLVAALHHLVPIRMSEEGLPAREAVDAVLRDNLHGLEIDERCCQIAAFALAFAAWTYPNTGGYRPLSDLHIACTGVGPQSTEEQWLRLAEEVGMPRRGHERGMMERALVLLHQLFSQAPTLGSLIDPNSFTAGQIAADYETIQPYLAAIFKTEKADEDTRERAIAAAGMTKAADLLAGDYTLVITNVPYLGRGDHCSILANYAEQHHPNAKGDLANMFLDRSLTWCSSSGSAALVTPWNWLFLTTSKHLRQGLLDRDSIHVVARVGEGGFRSPMAAGAFPALSIISRKTPSCDTTVAGADVSATKAVDDKAKELRTGALQVRKQEELRSNPDSIISFEVVDEARLLSLFAYCYQGTSTGDTPRLVSKFWEIRSDRQNWLMLQVSPDKTGEYGGREHIVRWPVIEGGFAGCAVRGNEAWGRCGIAIGQMRSLPATLYTGERFSNSTPVLIPHCDEHLPALWAFCRTPVFCEALRALNPKLSVDNGYVAKIAWDYAHWQEVAAKKYPDGLPEPESDDPTQWLFHGHPREADEDAMLQVAVVRLLGYRWPAELDDKMRLSKRARALVEKCGELAKFADNDGIVCIPAVRGEDPAADRLLRLLDACNIEPGVDLDDWLRNGFFEEHCKLFHDRPFIWHIWDGRKRDGFHALVNYHKLAEGGGKGRRLLESLTYAYLGDWIKELRYQRESGAAAADDRLAAALELQKRLKAIIEGEPPFDIFIRWKPLYEQPIGWEPDINDGVRMNIRPFLASDLPTGGRAGAGILRYRPHLKSDKDRGKEPDRPKAEYPWFWNWDERTEDFMGTGKEPNGNRWNDCHYTNKVKQQAREAARTKD
ncbi:MAG: BREX-1 system adenine-specific DNA-methyltransferase PglX [Planctomycetes bacterium]|nr:BREX-1 system adenine-specific DNA-methyltransferase PglX [Planctomycetota bacterium]